jgi:hypothetical protein
MAPIQQPLVALQHPWGDVSDEDRKENEYSLEHGFRLLSTYRTHAGDKLWIITESDRSVTIRPEQDFLEKGD